MTDRCLWTRELGHIALSDPFHGFIPDLLFTFPFSIPECDFDLVSKFCTDLFQSEFCRLVAVSSTLVNHLAELTSGAMNASAVAHVVHTATKIM